MRNQLLRLLGACVMALGTVLATASPASACGLSWDCNTEADNGAIEVEFSGGAVAGLVAADAAAAVDYAWRLRDPCVLSDEREGSCSGVDFQACPQEPGQVVRFLVVERRPVVGPDGTAVVAVPVGSQPGDLLGRWTELRRGCIDITALNPAPSPEEVFRYFERLPLPQLPTHQQPPGDALVGLPVIFFTDGPTTQTYSLDIRGFTVDIVATAQSFTWHTGDGAHLTTADPGAPYPDHTVTHDYASGTYTAFLTTTWSGTFSVDGSASVDVPGTTTTDGPAVTFTVVEARAVLTNPYD